MGAPAASSDSTNWPGALHKVTKTSRIPASGKYSYYRYFRIDNRARRWGSHVTTCGESRIIPGSSYPPTEHPPVYHFSWEQGRTLTECQIVYISEGQGTIETKESSFQIRAGDALLLRPGLWHRYKPAADTGWHEHWVGIGGTNVEHLLRDGLFSNRALVIAIREERSLLEGFHHLFNAAEAHGPAFQQEMAARASVLISLLYGSTLPASAGKGSDLTIVERARAMMLAEQTSDMSLETMAKTLNTSYSKFRRLFRESTGVSLNQYRIHLKISSARELLRSTNLMIKEISYRCGFEEEHYFCRLFKIHTGISPSEFRLQCLPAKTKTGRNREDPNLDFTRTQVKGSKRAVGESDARSGGIGRSFRTTVSRAP